MRYLTRLFVAFALFALAALAPANAQQSGSGAWNLFSTGAITPAATAAAIATVQQTFTVQGLTASSTQDVILSGPAPTSLCPPVGARVSAANTLQIDFLVLTAAACTPAAGTYGVLVRTR